MKCKNCKKQIKKNDSKTKTGLSYVHDYCLKDFIAKTLNKTKLKKIIVKKSKVKKKSRMWFRKHAIELAKTKAKERDGYICQHCGKDSTQAQIHGSHVKSVGSYLFLACDLLNIKALCARCHKWWWHSEPTEAGKWFKNKFPERYEYLKQKIRDYKGDKVDWEKEYNKLRSR